MGIVRASDDSCNNAVIGLGALTIRRLVPPIVSRMVHVK